MKNVQEKIGYTFKNVNLLESTEKWSNTDE